VDARSDIFSFGSILYEMTTGKRAFEADSSMSTLGAIIHKEAEPLTSKVPHDLKKVITRCLRKEPERRFQHMDDLKIVLEELKQEYNSGALETERRRSRVRLARACGKPPWPVCYSSRLRAYGLFVPAHRRRKHGLRPYP
jgi:serine/threonine protein kinase